MRGWAVCIALAASLASASAGAAVELIGAFGATNTKQLEAALERQGEAPVRVVSAVGAVPGRVPLLNRVFGVSLPTSKLFGAAPTLGLRAAVCPKAAPDAPLVVIDGGACGRCATGGGGADDLVSEEQATAFAQGLADVVLVNVDKAAGDAMNQAATAATLECIVRERTAAAAGAGGAKALLLFVVHDSEDGGDEAREAELGNQLAAAADAAGVAPSELGALFDVEVAFVPPPADAAYEPTLEALSSRFVDGMPNACLKPEYSQGVAAAAFGGAVGERWAATRARCGGSGDSGGAQSPGEAAELAARFEVEAAYYELSDSAEATLARWRASVDSGRAVPAFGAKAAELFETTLAAYDEATAAAEDVGGAATRAERRAALGKQLNDAIKELHARQLDDAERHVLRALKSALLKAQRKAKGALSPDAAVAARDGAAFAFDAAVAPLAVGEPLELGVEEAAAKFATEASEAVATFAQSIGAQLQAAKFEEQKATSRRPRERGIVAGMQLVGMLRPKGLSNLSGFLTYALGPHSVLFGYSNDADVATDENGGPVPLIRMQPKLDLNVDL